MIRPSPYRTANKLPWYRAYRARIRDCQEFCRNCKVRDDLTFGHIMPVARGGRPTFTNTTILCVDCNRKQGEELWPWQVSLAEEEASAPPERRWSQVHPEAIRAARLAAERRAR